VFASTAFRDLHERLIQKSFPQGRIQLLRIDAGDATMAALYNFVYAGKAYFYQSGLRSNADKHLKPGLVAHTCAIEHCQQVGLLEYDFGVTTSTRDRLPTVRAC
jgi:CelD/BcsL family acetyltransferase involved in cellulose biosynthesis